MYNTTYIVFAHHNVILDICYGFFELQVSHPFFVHLKLKTLSYLKTKQNLFDYFTVILKTFGVNKALTPKVFEYSLDTNTDSMIHTSTLDRGLLGFKLKSNINSKNNALNANKGKKSITFL